MVEVAVHAPGGVERAHKKGETWVVTRGEGGKPVEYLMGLCGECGQPRILRPVIRFSDNGIREWNAAEERGCASRWTPLWMLVVSLVALALGYVAGVSWASIGADIGESIGVGAAVVLGTMLVYLLFDHRGGARRSKEAEEHKRRILVVHGHGNIPPKEVGTREQGWKEYVILPAA